MVQILHISDLHLLTQNGWSSWLAWLFNQLPLLNRVYTFADPDIKAALALELSRIVTKQQATILALTGDIAAWPGDSSTDINQELYTYVDSLRRFLHPGSEIFPVLGNHDWGDGAPFPRQTNFLNTDFQKIYSIVNPRVRFVQSGGLTVVFFFIDTNWAIIPATGEVRPDTKDFLLQCFQEGRTNNLLGLSSQTYDQAVKIMLLHHSPLPYASYGGALSSGDYRSLQLVNASDFLDLCKADVDIFLFGHTHVPSVQAYQGFVMVDTGSTLGTTLVTSSFDPTLHLLRILDRDTVEVELYSWKRTMFLSRGSKSVTFKRGQAPVGTLGQERWT